MLSQAEQDAEKIPSSNAEEAESPRHEPDDNLADIRLCFGKYFLVLIAGKERRDLDRLTAEREARPVFVAKNIPLLIMIWGSLIFTFYHLVVYGISGFISLFT